MDYRAGPPLPPPPGARTGLPVLPERFRHRIGLVAVAVSTVGAIMWGLSFIPGAPTARFWPAIVFPAFFLMFPLFGITIVDIIGDDQRRPSRTVLPIPLRGWRIAAAATIFIVGWLSGMNTFASGAPSGQPHEDNGRYFANNHGTITELTEDQWRRSNAGSQRLFAGGVMIFAGLAALYLTQRVDADEPSFTPPPAAPGHPVTKWLARLTGTAVVTETGHGEPDDVVARLRLIVPIRMLERAADGSMTVHAEWFQEGPWPTRGEARRLDGRVIPAGAGASTFDVTVQPAARLALLRPIAAIVGPIVMLAFASRILTANGLPDIGMVFIPIWMAFAMLIAYVNLTAGRRITRRAMRRVSEAVAGG